ncbi:MAG TPA: WXG100 family type VII secretion target [Phycisphaerae bacterium]|nr:WXG100 family type VII secretion target [Phycisphaerae bacterium]
MAKAHVDPAELRRFAQDLNRFNNDLESLMGGLHARMRNLESTWRDQEHRKFAEAFEQTMKVLAVFLEASRDHVSFLAKKAGHVEEYLKQR